MVTHMVTAPDVVHTTGMAEESRQRAQALSWVYTDGRPTIRTALDTGRRPVTGVRARVDGRPVPATLVTDELGRSSVQIAPEHFMGSGQVLALEWEYTVDLEA